MERLLSARAVASWKGAVLVIGALSVPLHIDTTRWGVSCDGEEIARVWPLGIGTGDPDQIAWATEIPTIITDICAGYPMYLSIFANPGGGRMFALIVGVIFPAVAMFAVAGIAISGLVKHLRLRAWG